MKRFPIIAVLICASFSATFAIGLQHGLFRAQSTQGAPWQGTATIVEEQFDLTVHADYLDVELEWVIEAGGTPPDSFADALEIVGNLNLEDKSVLVSMITWYKGMVLQGKLKTSDVAREQYEDVVQRSSDAPPPPRDPVLIEWIRDDNYDISVFPVSFGGTRKVRMRYLVPAFTVKGVNQIAYPHAFTENAKVSVRAGSDVKGYRVVNSDEPGVLYDNSDLVPLSASAYGFSAYSQRIGGGPSIKHIVPVLGGRQVEGSVMYVGQFSNATFGGEVLHVSTMTGEEALKLTSMPEDYVILWRWNHPQILEKYARQIVGQSAMLREFLSALNAANKRAALVVDREGGERTVFTLDRPGGSHFKKMAAFLEDLASRVIVDPPARATPRTGDIAFDIDKAFAEFEAAIAAAMDQFEKDAAAMRHLLILTAGPKLVSSYTANKPTLSDSTVNVSLFSSYVRSNGGSEADLGSLANSSYWPGVDLERYVAEHRAGLTVTATVVNGTGKNEIVVMAGTESPIGTGTGAVLVRPYYGSCEATRTTQMHLYSSTPVTRTILWRVLRGDQVLAEFPETPRVVVLDDGMQYARVICGSPHLTPMASTMPSSLASTLGFVDEKYSLVALEDDALPEQVARLYDKEGVPLLTAGEIFAGNDERPDVPVADWLALHKPEPMGESRCYYGWEVMRGGIQILMAVDTANAMVFEDIAGPARVATPAAETIYAPDPEAMVDYESALAPTGRLAAAPARSLSFRSIGGRIAYDLGTSSIRRRTSATIVLHDLSGRVVMQWRVVDLAAAVGYLPMRSGRIPAGTYLLRAYGLGGAVATPIVIR